MRPSFKCNEVIILGISGDLSEGSALIQMNIFMRSVSYRRSAGPDTLLNETFLERSSALFKVYTLL